MRLTNRVLISLLLAAISLSAFAVDGSAHTRYRWKDAQGAVHFSDTLPPEALQSGYDVVDGTGLVVKHIDRAKSVEEKKADAIAAAAAAEAKQRALDQSKADEQLLIAYGTEQDLAAAQKSRIDAIDQSIQNVQMSQADQEKALSEQLAHAATFERDSKPVPVPVQQQIETLRKNIAMQKDYIARKERERAETELRSEAEMTHYHELRAKQATAAH